MEFEPIFKPTSKKVGEFTADQLKPFLNQKKEEDDSPFDIEMRGGGGGGGAQDDRLKCPQCGYQISIADVDQTSNIATCPVCDHQFSTKSPGGAGEGEGGGGPSDEERKEQQEPSQDAEGEPKENAPTEEGAGGDANEQSPEKKSDFDDLDDAAADNNAAKADAGAVEDVDQYDENGNPKPGSQAAQDSPADQQERKNKTDELAKDLAEQASEEKAKQAGGSGEGEGQRGGGPGTGSGKRIPNDLGVDADTIAKAMPGMIGGFETKSAWRKKLRQIILDASGIKEAYSSTVPSRRIEGQWGADVEVNALKTVVLTLDCSGSMGGQVFKAALKEIHNVFTTFKQYFGNATVWFFCWTTTMDTFKKKKGISKEYLQFMLRAQPGGGTDMYAAHHDIFKKVPRADLWIVLSDMETSNANDAQDKAVFAKFRKNRRKTVWVLPPGTRMAHVSKGLLPNGWKKNTIEIKERN